MKTIFTLFLALMLQLVLGQTIDITPYPLNLNNPGEEKTYTASTSQATGCGVITWTITNGSLINSTGQPVTTLNGNPVKVKWDDVTAKGKLKATVSCSEGPLSVEKEFPICSLSGMTPQNPKIEH